MAKIDAQDALRPPSVAKAISSHPPKNGAFIGQNQNWRCGIYVTPICAIYRRRTHDPTILWTPATIPISYNLPPQEIFGTNEISCWYQAAPMALGSGRANEPVCSRVKCLVCLRFMRPAQPAPGASVCLRANGPSPSHPMASLSELGTGMNRGLKARCHVRESHAHRPPVFAVENPDGHPARCLGKLGAVNDELFL